MLLLVASEEACARGRRRTGTRSGAEVGSVGGDTQTIGLDRSVGRRSWPRAVLRDLRRGEDGEQARGVPARRSASPAVVVVASTSWLEPSGAESFPPESASSGIRRRLRRIDQPAIPPRDEELAAVRSPCGRPGGAPRPSAAARLRLRRRRRRRRLGRLAARTVSGAPGPAPRGRCADGSLAPTRLPERERELRRSCVAIVPRLRHRLRDHVVDLSRQVGTLLRQLRRRLEEVRVHHRDLRVLRRTSARPSAPRT